MAQEKDKELDYAIGRLVAEVSALRESDDRLANEMKSFSNRLDEVEAGANAAKGAIKVASWLLGSILAMLISLGAWMVHATIVNEEQRDILQRDLERHINSSGHQGTMDILYELRTNIQTIQSSQSQEAEHTKNVDNRLERLEKRRR